MEDRKQGGNQEQDSLDKEVAGQVDNQEQDRAVHMLVVDNQPKEELAGQCATSAELGALPLVGVQTSHHACPFQPCAESANCLSSNYHVSET